MGFLVKPGMTEGVLVIPALPFVIPNHIHPSFQTTYTRHSQLDWESFCLTDFIRFPIEVGNDESEKFHTPGV